VLGFVFGLVFGSYHNWSVNLNHVLTHMSHDAWWWSGGRLDVTRSLAAAADTGQPMSIMHGRELDTSLLMMMMVHL